MECSFQIETSGDNVSLPSVENVIRVLQNCRVSKNLKNARHIHINIHNIGLETNIAIGNHLVPLYVQCDSLLDAHQVFLKLEFRNEFSWTSIIQAYTEAGDSQNALILFNEMQNHSVCPNGFTLVAAMKACAKQRDKYMCRELHAEAVTRGLEHEAFVGNMLVDMYSKCQLLSESQCIFDRQPVHDIVGWNALIGGYSDLGFGDEALKCLDRMQKEGLSPDIVTYVCCLKACISSDAVKKGQELHRQFVEEGFEDCRADSLLMSLYSKSGLLEDAQEMFDELDNRDVVLWTSLITGYSEYGSFIETLHHFRELLLEGISPDLVAWTAVILSCAKEGASEEANSLFVQMLEQAILPDRATYVSILIAFGTVSDLETGRKVHARLLSSQRNITDVSIAATLIDMYGKCGSTTYAQEVFDTFPNKVLPVWNALVAGYARQGESTDVFCILKSMLGGGLCPDGITFIGLMTLCSHTGFTEQAQTLFEAMVEKYGIFPSIKHVNCMIDILGRAGRLDEAAMLVRKSPFLYNDVAWVTLLGSCKISNDIELGREVFSNASEIDVKHGAMLSLMCNILGDNNLLDFDNEDLVQRFCDEHMDT